MTKRNWDEMANDLANILNKNDTVKKPCYEIPVTNIVTKTTNKYVYDKFYNKPVNISKKSFYLRNHLNGKDIRICKDNDISFRELEETFGNIGHCLAYKISDSYVTKLMLDFDCYKCKTNNCNNIVEIEIIQLIHDDIITYLKDLFDNVQCVIFKKVNSCNLHLYFNISISLPVLELLRKRLLSYLDESITSKYLIDDIIMLDLPYSTKDGNEIYKYVYSTANCDYKNFTILPNDSNFYDIKLKLSIDEVYDTHITLGNFKTVHSSEWNDDVEYVKYLLTPIEFKPFKVKCENSLIINMKMIKISNFKTDFTNLSNYLKIVTNKTEDDTISLNIDDYSNDEKKMYQNILELGKIFSNKIYKCDNYLNNVLRFIMVDNGNCAFYVICVIIFHFHKINSTMSIDTCKNLVIKILKEIISESKDDSLLHIIQSIENINCMSNLNDVFENSDDWFQYLINVCNKENIKDVSENEKQIMLVYIQLKVYDSLESIYAELVDVCKKVIPIIKVEHGYNKIHYYVEAGIYISIAMDKFFSTNTVQIQVIEKLFHSMLNKLIQNNQITNDIVDKVKMKDMWIKYLESISIKNPKFNFYDYFISTDLGVFNTLTGLYMRHTPLLYMNTQKSYCRIPINVPKNISMSELNRYIMNENQEQLYKNILDIMLTEQKKIFYGSVMVPGLFCLDETLYDEKQEINMLNLIFEMIMNDDNDINEKLLYFTEPLINKYKLSVMTLLELSNVLQQNLCAYGKFTREDLNIYCNCKNIEISNVKKFEHKNGVTLYDQLQMEHSNIFKPKLFVLAIVISVFENAHGSNKKIKKLSHTTGDVIHISQNHLFYNIDTYSMSIKSYDNIRRILEYLINGNISNSLLNIVHTISNMLSNNDVMIDDFLTNFSMIYNHNSKRKKLTILIGSPNSGKSTYQHMLCDMHGRSTCSITSIIQAEGQGPSPEIVNALSKYLFSVIELKSMNATTMKSMISGDITHKRLCHQNEMLELKPLSFAVAAANNLPTVYQADEAVRDRMAPFLFKSVFINEKDIDNIIDDNALLARVCNYMISTTNFQISDIAREFSNLLYEKFVSNRDSYGLSQSKISNKNENSLKLINQILIKNNIIYYILYVGKIIFDDNLFVTYETLEEQLTPEIEKYNDTTKHKRYNWKIFKNELSLLFKHKETADGTGIRGMGLQINVDDNEFVKFDFIIKKDSTFTSYKDIKSYLYHVKKYKYDQIKNILKNITKVYEIYYDSQKNGIRDHIIKYET